MDMENQNLRRIGVRDLLSKYGFSLSNARDKSDEFKTYDGKAIYFYWKQGGGINIAIDPHVPFDALKSIPGIEFSKKAKGFSEQPAIFWRAVILTRQFNRFIP